MFYSSINSLRCDCGFMNMIVNKDYGTQFTRLFSRTFIFDKMNEGNKYYSLVVLLGDA